MTWKTILALAVLAAPLAWCEAQHGKDLTAMKIACTQQGFSWGGWGEGKCEVK